MKKKLKRYSFLIGLIVVLGLLIRVFGIKFVSSDYTLFLEPWFEEIKTNGGFKALKDYPGNYTAPYMTIVAFLTYFPVSSLVSIKIVSIIFDFVLAFVGVLLAKELLEKGEARHNENLKDIIYLFIFGLLISLPTIVFNSSAWGQCDSIYVTFCVLSLVFLLRKKYAISLFVFGIALAFKLQAIFLLPVFGIYFFARLGRYKEGEERFRFLYFFLIPIGVFIMSIPAIMMGMPIRKVFDVYFMQAGYYQGRLTSNFPNIYALLPNGINTRIATIVGVVATAVLLFALLIFVVKRKKELSAVETIKLSVVVLMICVLFLPMMHERYFYLGEVLCLIYCLAEWKDFWLAIGVEAIALGTYVSFSFGLIGVLPVYSMVFIGICLGWIYKCYLEEASGSKITKLSSE